MEYLGKIQNCTFIPNITPIEPFLPLQYITQILPFPSIEPFIPFAKIESFLFSIRSLSSIAYIESITYIEPFLPFLYLLPLALLAFFILITLLITYKNKQYTDTDDELTDVELSDEELTDDELSEDEFTDEYENDYTSSIIEESIIVNRDGDIVSDNKKFRGILVDIWKTMEKQDILDNTTFKFKSGNKRGVKGYNLCEGINMSFQNRDSNATLNEILRMVKLNNLAIYLSIKLETGEIVHIID